MEQHLEMQHLESRANTRRVAIYVLFLLVALAGGWNLGASRESVPAHDFVAAGGSSTVLAESHLTAPVELP